MVNDRRSGPLQTTCRGALTAPLRILLLLIVATIVPDLSPADADTSTAPTGPALEREATDAFNRAEYDRVLKLWRSLSAETATSKPLIRLALQSSI